MALTNKQVIDFFDSCGKKKCVEFLIEKDSQEVTATSKSFEKSVEKLKTQVKSLKKSARDSSKCESFLAQTFVFPKSCESKRVPKFTSNDSIDSRSAVISEKKKNLQLLEKCSELHVTKSQLEQELDYEKIKGSNLNQKLKNTKTILKRTAARESYTYKKCQKLEETINCNVDVNNNLDESQFRISFLENQVKEKDKEIRELQSSIEYLEHLLQDNKTELNVFDNDTNRYSSDLKTCVYELLQYQVSASKVSNVIESVLKLANIKANRLPCKSSVLQMSLQRLYLAQVHIGEIFCNDPNTVLLTDETSKFGAKYMGYEASDSDGNLWVLGLRDIETKSSSDTLKVFKEILQDLDDVTMVANNETSKNVICHIVATLSDRAATEVKFNQLLSDFRKEILPLTYQNYDTFTDEEKLPLENMCNFFCGLHALVNFAETCRTCIKEVEKGIFEQDIPICDKSYKDSDPGSCRLVRTASKAFGEGSGGDEKSGCQGTFKVFSQEFLRQHGFTSIPLRSYRGARFNILFQNAAVVFLLHSQMKEYLESYGAENKLLKSILFDLKTKEFVAGVKALGIISKLLTCPLWTVLESKEVSIIDMNEKYLMLVTFLEDASNNIRNFMRGELLPFGQNTYIEKGPIYDALMTSDTYDDTVEMFLQVLLPALCQLSKRLFKDHLPGGHLSTLSEDMKNKVKNAPKTSCFAESVFGQLDHLLRTKPNISTMAAEACIMFLNNKTLVWLENKDDSTRDKLIKKASKEVKTIRKKYQIRLNEIHENRRLALQEKIQKREALQQEKLQKQEQYTKDILHHGLWQSEVEVDNMVNSYETTAKQIEAIKAQLKFRKDVLHQIADDKTVYNVSKSREGKKSRKSLGVEELKTNLKCLVRQAVVKDLERNEQKHILVGKRVKHRFKCGDEYQWYTGKVISQVPYFPDWFNIVYDEDDAVYTYHQLQNDVEQADLVILV